jgi:hypothetical protein
LLGLFLLIFIQDAKLAMCRDPANGTTVKDLYAGNILILSTQLDQVVTEGFFSFFGDLDRLILAQYTDEFSENELLLRELFMGRHAHFHEDLEDETTRIMMTMQTRTRRQALQNQPMVIDTTQIAQLMTLVHFNASSSYKKKFSLHHVPDFVKHGSACFDKDAYAMYQQKFIMLKEHFETFTEEGFYFLIHSNFRF